MVAEVWHGIMATTGAGLEGWNSFITLNINVTFNTVSTVTVIIDGLLLERTRDLNVSLSAVLLILQTCPPLLNSVPNPPDSNISKTVPSQQSQSIRRPTQRIRSAVVPRGKVALILCHRLLNPAPRILFYSRHDPALCWCCVSTLEFVGICKAGPLLNRKSTHRILKQLLPLFFCFLLFLVTAASMSRGARSMKQASCQQQATHGTK